MKVYKIELIVIDFDEAGEEEIVNLLENADYPNHFISPKIKKVESRDVGKWYDNHPLNLTETENLEYERLFAHKST